MCIVFYSVVFIEHLLETRQLTMGWKHKEMNKTIPHSTWHIPTIVHISAYCISLFMCMTDKAGWELLEAYPGFFIFFLYSLYQHNTLLKGVVQ